MIKFEHNMLVLNNAFSREDVEEINAFAEHVRNQERERIIDLLNHEYWHNISYLSDIHYDCLMCEAIKIIKGEN